MFSITHAELDNILDSLFAVCVNGLITVLLVLYFSFNILLTFLANPLPPLLDSMYAKFTLFLYNIMCVRQVR